MGIGGGIHTRPLPGSFSSQAAAPEIFQELQRLQVTQKQDCLGNLVWDEVDQRLGWESARNCLGFFSGNWPGICREFVGFCWEFAGNFFGRSKG